MPRKYLFISACAHNLTESEFECHTIFSVHYSHQHSAIVYDQQKCKKRKKIPALQHITRKLHLCRCKNRPPVVSVRQNSSSWVLHLSQAWICRRTCWRIVCVCSLCWCILSSQGLLVECPQYMQDWMLYVTVSSTQWSVFLWFWMCSEFLIHKVYTPWLCYATCL